jgi:hypothetical protein
MSVNKTLLNATKLMNPNLRHILEFGVFRGKTIKQLRKTLGDEYKIFGFDSFEGLPEEWEGVNAPNFSTNGSIPNIPRVTFFKGWFKDTIPSYLEIGESIALLHVDCDLYSSTKTVLAELNHLIVPSTIIVFDEWFYNHLNIPANCQHEQKAFYEWVSEFNRSYELLPVLEDERQAVMITATIEKNSSEEEHSEY